MTLTLFIKAVIKGRRNRTIAGVIKTSDVHSDQLLPGSWHLGDWRSIFSAPIFWNKKVLLRRQNCFPDKCRSGNTFPLCENAQCFALCVINNSALPACMLVCHLHHTLCTLSYLTLMTIQRSGQGLRGRAVPSTERCLTGACYVPSPSLGTMATGRRVWFGCFCCQTPCRLTEERSHGCSIWYNLEGAGALRLDCKSPEGKSRLHNLDLSAEQSLAGDNAH